MVQIESPVEGLDVEAVRHLQGLLRLDTTNPPGNEIAAARYLAGILADEGYQPVIVESAAGRGNVIARYSGSGEEAPLLLYGHTDVVTAEAGSWSWPPFSGELAEGCVWGRGALDMKSTVAQQLMVMLLLRRSGARLRRDVIFAATADEEAGGSAGIGYLVDHVPDLIRAEYALSEGGGTTMYVAGQAFYDIRTGEKGTCRFRLRATGRPGHGSVPRPETAVARIAQAVTVLAGTQLPFHPTVTASQFFSTVAAALGLPPNTRRLTAQNLERVVQILPSEFGYYLQAITHNTATPTGLRAGSRINVIPGEAEAWIDGRYLPGQTPDSFLDEVRHIIGSGFEIERVDLSPAIEDPAGGSLYDTIVSVMRRYAPHATVIPALMSGATDAKHVTRLGATCLGFGPLRVPETFPAEHLVHGHDERIPIDGYLWGIQVLHDIVCRFCA